MEGERSDACHEGWQTKRSLAEESVNDDNDGVNGINYSKKRARDGRMNTVMGIDLCVKLEEENGCGGESGIKEKTKRNFVDNLNQVRNKGEPVEAYEGIRDREKPFFRVSKSVSDSEIVEKSKLESLHKEVDRMKEENSKLKLALSMLMNNYQNLQMHPPDPAMAATTKECTTTRDSK
ncbi:hypothetical protein KI387_003006, partial [Taxus chinensis]